MIKECTERQTDQKLKKKFKLENIECNRNQLRLTIYKTIRSARNEGV